MSSQPCMQSHYATIVEPHKDAEVYQIGDCLICLQRMAEKHEVLAKAFRDRLGELAAAAARQAS